MDITKIINEVLENITTEEDAALAQQFDELIAELEESRKSNLVRILIGHGAIEKKNGKLVMHKRKGNTIKNQLGIK